MLGAIKKREPYLAPDSYDWRVQTACNQHPSKGSLTVLTWQRNKKGTSYTQRVTHAHRKGREWKGCPSSPQHSLLQQLTYSYQTAHSWKTGLLHHRVESLWPNYLHLVPSLICTPQQCHTGDYASCTETAKRQVLSLQNIAGMFWVPLIFLSGNFR